MRFSTAAFTTAFAATGLLVAQAAPLNLFGVNIPVPTVSPIVLGGGTDPVTLALACISVGGTISDKSTVCKLKDGSVITANLLTSNGLATIKIGSGAKAGESIVIKIGDLGGLLNNLLGPAVSTVSSVVSSVVVVPTPTPTPTAAPTPVNTATVCEGRQPGDIIDGVLCPVVTIVSQVLSAAVPIVSEVVSVVPPIVSQVVSIVPPIVSDVVSLVGNIIGPGSVGPVQSGGAAGNILSLGLPAPSGLPLLSLGGGKILRSEDGKKRLASEEQLE